MSFALAFPHLAGVGMQLAVNKCPPWEIHACPRHACVHEDFRSSRACPLSMVPGPLGLHTCGLPGGSLVCAHACVCLGIKAGPSCPASEGGPGAPDVWKADCYFPGQAFARGSKQERKPGGKGGAPAENGFGCHASESRSVERDRQSHICVPERPLRWRQGG